MLSFLDSLASLSARPGYRTALPGLHGSSLPLALTRLAADGKGPLLVICADSPHCARLERELGVFASDAPVLQFPDWETLPFDTFSPHQDIVSERLLVLNRLPAMQRGILLVSLSSLLLRLAPPEFVAINSLVLKTGEIRSLTDMRRQLEQAGYRCVAEVMEHGEFAVRGAILDLFPMGSTQPYRLDFFDDELDTIRSFDPDTQISGDKLDAITLLPAHEYPWNDQAISKFRQAFRARFEAALQPDSVYAMVSKGLAPAGIECYLPLFFDQLASLFIYLPADTRLVTLGDLPHAANQFWKDLRERHEERSVDPLRPLVAPQELYLREDEVFAALNNWPRYTDSEALQTDSSVLARALPDVRLDTRASVPLASLHAFSLDFDGKIIVSAESAGRREVLLPLLRQSGIEPELCESWQDALASKKHFCLTTAPLETGFISSDGALALITEPDLFGAQLVQQRRRRKRVTDPDAVIRNLAELRVGDPVVHVDHGVGRYQGLQTLSAAGVEAEYLVLLYNGGDKLYVPVQSLHLIGRYMGAAADSAPWHKLGSEAWGKARQKAAEKIRDVAAELLEIQARRAANKGIAANFDHAEYQRFAAGFPFEETPDQEATIASVLRDMCRDKPMDRLVCGDVGFGKTEVAMRAAFAAVQTGWQVLVLVPTTLLAQQHYNSFCDRFADWPVRIELLSRFRSEKEQKKAIDQLAEGKIDILVGTHKLLSPDLKTARLGLLIVDEEHRFGVRQKEQIKALCHNVHMLTLTATPIPRTLNMALSGIRDLSLITTPPAKRLAIKTFVREKSDALIKEACQRELLRGGQVYYLHNDVESIERAAEHLQTLLPDARVAVAHGQMRERELERIMRDFYHQRFHILVCSTIVETGIDVPTANTIIMDRADKLGLAQLHQLRGRVGRSHHQAYAYLMTPPKNLLTSDAEKRLEAIAAFDDLGAGFLLASQDLEIRGAGELLGEEQSGQIEGIGLSLYLELLESTVKAMKEGREPTLQYVNSQRTEIEAGLPALLPDIYVHDIATRLSLYKRITSAADDEALDDLQAEIVDRFGALPDAGKNLFALAHVRLAATELGLKRIDLTGTGARVEFHSHTPIEPLHLIQLVQKQPKRFRFEGPQHIRISQPLPDAELRLPFLHQILRDLGAGVKKAG